MTFFRKFRCQIGPPTLRAMGIPRTPPESRLARWALGAARYDPTCDLCKVRICRNNYAVIHDAHQAKRDSGGVRGIPIALSVGGPIWHRNFWKKVITDHQNLAHLGNKNETWTKTQKIFGRPKSGRAEKERLYVATTRTLSAQAKSHRRNSEVTPVERIALT